jgi:hypothetical protein
MKKDATLQAERLVAGWVREIKDPGAFEDDSRAMDDLVDLVALQGHNGKSLIVTTTRGGSDPLDGEWLDDMLSHGPDGRGLSANWLIQAVYAQAHILSTRTGAVVIDTISLAAAQLETAARARPVWGKQNELAFASLRRVVDKYLTHPRNDAREKLAKQPRQSLSLAIHSLMDPDVPPIGFPRSAPAPVVEKPPVRRSWLGRVRDAITQPSTSTTTTYKELHS